MDIKVIKGLKKLFTESNKCDFCDRSDRIIIGAFVHPLLVLKDGAMVVSDVMVAKKCMGCIEEESK
jgi:hypothetical protein